MKYNPPWNTQFGRPVDDPEAPYINANPSAGIEGSVPPAESIEYPQREIVNAAHLAGFNPSNDDLEQLTRGIRQGTAYAIATVISGGDPNVLYVNLNPKLDAYRPGLVVRLKIPVENTGPVGINIDNLGMKSITRASGAVMSAADLRANMIANIVYDGNVFQLINYQGFSSTTTNENTYIVNVPYCVDLGSANHIIAPFSPPITTLTAGLFVFVKIAAANTGRTFISVNGLPEVELIRTDLRGTGPSDIIGGMVCGMVYDGAKFQMVSFPASILRDLVAPMSYYVNPTTGLDTNDGLTPATAFQHINYALSQMNRWNNRGTEFYIRLAAGVYQEGVTLYTINGSGYANLVGDVDNPQNCVIWDNVGSSSNTSAITVVGENWRVYGVKLQSNAGGGLNVTIGTCYVWNVDVGQCGYSGLSVNYGGRLLLGRGDLPGFIRFSSSVPYPFMAQLGSTLLSGGSIPVVTLQITAPMSMNVFAYARYNSTIGFNWGGGITGAGNVSSGAKYGVSENSALTTDQVLPGPSPGFANTGGIYQGP
jgi:hypothetical protein